MSFGCSIGDIVLLSNLAWKTIQNTRNACGEHHELTSELLTFHTVLRRLELEVSKPESPLNSPGDSSKEDVERIVSGCRKPLSLLNKVVEKYNLLSQEEKSLKKLWLQVRFGNGEVANTRDIRGKISSHTSALTLYLNLMATGSVGRVEKQMEDAGSDLREVKKAVNNLTARLVIGPHSEGSVLTTRTNDDKAVWKEFRRSLLKEGFDSSLLKKHKSLIEAYLRELGERGVLDDSQHSDEAIGARVASGAGLQPPRQSEEAAVEDATGVEIKKGDRNRSASPALEDTNDSMDSSGSVTVGIVNWSGLSESVDDKPQRKRPISGWTVWPGKQVDHKGSIGADLRCSQRMSASIQVFRSGWLWAGQNAPIGTLVNWKWDCIHRLWYRPSGVVTLYGGKLCELARLFIASPWGICDIFYWSAEPDLLADFEYLVLIEQASMATGIPQQGHDHEQSWTYLLIQRTVAGAELEKEIPRFAKMLREAGMLHRHGPPNADCYTPGQDDVGLSCTGSHATDSANKSNLGSLTSHRPIAIIRKCLPWEIPPRRRLQSNHDTIPFLMQMFTSDGYQPRFC